MGISPAYDAYRSNELIASPGHCSDEAVLSSSFPQDAPEQRDVLREVVLLDRGIRPDGPNDLLLIKYGAGVLHQVGERVIPLGREPNRAAVKLQQEPLGSVQAKAGEFINRHVAVTSVFRSSHKPWVVGRHRSAPEFVSAVGLRLQQPTFQNVSMAKLSPLTHSVD